MTASVHVAAGGSTTRNNQVTAMGISSPKGKNAVSAYTLRSTGQWMVIAVAGIDRETGPVRILSVVLMITLRHTGNT